MMIVGYYLGPLVLQSVNNYSLSETVRDCYRSSDHKAVLSIGLLPAVICSMNYSLSETVWVEHCLEVNRAASWWILWTDVDQMSKMHKNDWYRLGRFDLEGLRQPRRLPPLVMKTCWCNNKPLLYNGKFLDWSHKMHMSKWKCKSHGNESEVTNFLLWKSSQLEGCKGLELLMIS